MAPMRLLLLLQDKVGLRRSFSSIVSATVFKEAHMPWIQAFGLLQKSSSTGSTTLPALLCFFPGKCGRLSPLYDCSKQR